MFPPNSNCSVTDVKTDVGKFAMRRWPLLFSRQQLIGLAPNTVV